MVPSFPPPRWKPASQRRIPLRRPNRVRRRPRRSLKRRVFDFVLESSNKNPVQSMNSNVMLAWAVQTERQ
jgi:hypothetical protein